MTGQEEAYVAGRLQRAALAFQTARNLRAQAHRRLKGLPAEEIEAFWSAPGERIQQHVAMTAKRLLEAFDAFAATGQAAPTADRRLISAAERVLAEAKA